MRTDIDWSHFVAYVLFLAASFAWVQARRGRGRAMTAIGMVGFLVVFWVVLRFWP